uniref:ABC transmembrane type-1 domain-containing protein n=1 Tax=Odontella aurita TaxID=265563 RepID=A0A7S4NGQ8_9STRA|mmetsp:Transcript_6638/g.19627  ORF Transcript_6638/g.19627 Transcript_6638/m.19627 type:complete len:649 (+) Transcript_6638:1-1947(+)
MTGVRSTALYFAAVGAFSFVCAFMQNMCMEVAAARTQRRLLTRWFGALLKQDAAFYDVYDPSVLAPTVEPHSRKVRRGLGRKLGEGVQFLTAFVGGLVYAFLSSWRVALVLLGTVPLVAISVYGAYRCDRDRPRRAREAYAAKAAAVAHNAVGAMRTVQCRNAGGEMARRYDDSVQDAYARSVAHLWRDGIIVGTALSSFFVLFCAFTFYGSYLLHQDVMKTGCDPSGSVDGVRTCASSGAAILGALLGVAFAAQGAAQMPPVFDAIREAREGCYPATIALKRCEGADAEEVVVALPRTRRSSSRSIVGGGLVGGGGGGDDDVEEGGETKRVRALLPRYVIDSSSSGGSKPKGMNGALNFRAVSFAFPTAPGESVLDDLSLTVRAGTTVALVGGDGNRNGNGNNNGKRKRSSSSSSSSPLDPRPQEPLAQLGPPPAPHVRARPGEIKSEGGVGVRRGTDRGRRRFGRTDGVLQFVGGHGRHVRGGQVVEGDRRRGRAILVRPSSFTFTSSPRSGGEVSQQPRRGRQRRRQRRKGRKRYPRRGGGGDDRSESPPPPKDGAPVGIGVRKRIMRRNTKRTAGPRPREEVARRRGVGVGRGGRNVVDRRRRLLLLLRRRAPVRLLSQSSHPHRSPRVHVRRREQPRLGGRGE